MIKNKSGIICLLSVLLFSLLSCNDDVTYSDMKNKERSAVKDFIEEKSIKVITYEEFLETSVVVSFAKNSS